MSNLINNGYASTTKSTEIITDCFHIPTKDEVDYNKIYLTNRTDLFGYFDKNRRVVKRTVYELIDSYNQIGEFLSPIVVDINTLNIVDGQHRINALEKILRTKPEAYIKVVFMDVPMDEKIRDRVIKEFQTGKHWSMKDYEESLLKSENGAMTQIKEFGEEHTLTQRKNKKGEITGFNSKYTYAVIFGRNIKNDIIEGNIVLTKETLKKAEIVHEELRNIVMACGMTVGAWFESFAWAWNEIRDTSSDKRLIKQLTLPVIYENINDYLIIPGKTTNKQEWCRCIRTAIGDMANEILQPVY